MNMENVKSARCLPALFLLITVFGFLPSCSNPDALSSADVPIQLLSLVANGTSGTATTTELTLLFDTDPSTLLLSDIVLLGATKGFLSGSGTSRTLSIYNVSLEDGELLSLSFTTQPDGYTISPNSMTVPVYVATPVIKFLSMSANGSSNAITTSYLTLVFDQELPHMVAGDFNISGARLNYIHQVGKVINLQLYTPSVENGEQVTLAVDDTRLGVQIVPNSKSCPVWIENERYIAFMGMSANGAAHVTTTTRLTLNFSSDPGILLAEHLSITGASLGSLTGTGRSRFLEIEDLAVEEGAPVRVDIVANPPGVVLSPTSAQTVVHVCTSPIAVTNFEASIRDGSASHFVASPLSGYRATHCNNNSYATTREFRVVRRDEE